MNINYEDKMPPQTQTPVSQASGNQCLFESVVLGLKFVNAKIYLITFVRSASFLSVFNCIIFGVMGKPYSCLCGSVELKYFANSLL